MRARQEEEMLAWEVSRGERVHALFLKFGESHPPHVEFGVDLIHHRPTWAMNYLNVCLSSEV